MALAFLIYCYSSRLLGYIRARKSLATYRCLYMLRTIGVAKPGHTRAAARASPIIAPASASYLDF